MRTPSAFIAGLVIALLAVASGIATAAGHVQTLVAFDPATGEFPEGIAFDKTGNIYVTLLPRDEFRRIDPSGAQDVVTFFAAGTHPAGVVVDARGVAYVAGSGLDFATFGTDEALRGVYRVERDGTTSRLPGSEAIEFPNDLTLDQRGNLYVTDTFGGAVWRIPPGGAAQLWAQHELLEGDGSFGLGFPIGANGIALRGNRLVVATTERGLLVDIPVNPDGSAGTPTTLAQAPELVGTDGIAVDVHGNVYAGVGGQDALVRVDNDGSIGVLATAEDGLNQPATLAFGTGRRDHKTLFVTNFAIFSPEPTPGVVTVDVGVPGRPVP